MQPGVENLRLKDLEKFIVVKSNVFLINLSFAKIKGFRFSLKQFFK